MINWPVDHREDLEKDEDKSKMRDESDEEIPPRKKSKTGKGKQSKKTAEKGSPRKETTRWK